jgi:hypothetical protein
VTSPALPSLQDFRSALSQCSHFADMFTFLSHGTLSSNNKIVRRTLMDAQNYVLENGLLYWFYRPRTKKIHRMQSTIKQLCVPTSLHAQVVTAFHDNFCAHAGTDRLYATIKSRY